MDSGNKNEMEQIQRGLEEFLEREIEVIGMSGEGRRGEKKGDNAGQIHIIGQSRERQPYYGAQASQPAEADHAVRQPRGTERPARSQAPEADHAVRQPRGTERPARLQAPEADRMVRQPWGTERPMRSQAPEADHAVRQPRGTERPMRSQTPESERPVKTQSKKSARTQAPAKKRQSQKEERSRHTKRALQEETQMTAKASNSGKAKKSQKKKHKKHRFLKFLAAVALIALLLGAGWYQLVGVVYAKMSFKEIASLAAEPMREDGVVNILLIGNDSRTNDEDGRSDAMILLSISNRTKTIYMTSILRDIYVDIPGHDGNRLNAAYSFGGAELLMETIEKNFDIPVNRYMLVNFEAFANLVDAVDGIDLDLSKEEIEYVNGYLWEYNILTERPEGTDYMDTSSGGLVHLNGPQALAYSRNRYIGTDFGRTERQRKVLTAVIKKLPSALLTNAGELMDGLLPNLTTNLTQAECFQLSLMAGKLLTYDIVSDSIPQPGTYTDVTIRKMQVLQVDFETNIKYLKEKIYGE